MATSNPTPTATTFLHPSSSPAFASLFSPATLFLRDSTADLFSSDQCRAATSIPLIPARNPQQALFIFSYKSRTPFTKENIDIIDMPSISGVSKERLNFRRKLHYKAVSRPRTEEYADVLHNNGFPSIKWDELVEDDDIGSQNSTIHKVSTPKEINERVNLVKSKLATMDDGEISISAYDTAWVALVQDVNGSGNPQFPSSLEWISAHQLPDGSWGDSAIFSAHDRLMNTLGCVVALRSWNIHPDKSLKGMTFVKENIRKLEDENEEHMPIGFEVAFPALIEMARKLDLDVPEDSPVLQRIYASRDLKLTKIPKEILHKVPTTLLHSLEGMADLEWEKLLRLQCSDGSFLFSPSSTAFALMNTKNENCLKYLNNAVKKFDGGVPNVYPVDLFEHIWAVDRLQRLGISRYFQSEIKDCVDYIHRHWTDKGICWARNSPVQDIDDTAMGFRVLRSHGYQVSPDVFRQFESEGEFVCFAGQSNQAVTGMYNLQRASQLSFPGETILEDAKKFSYEFLRDKQASNEIVDKWIITKDLPGEVAYALDVPWYASLPRVETRLFLEQYGGEDDVWIGKTLYRMSKVNNNLYLELAKLDYDNIQTLHQMEWNQMQEWYGDFTVGEIGKNQSSLLMSYYLAAASIYEPERSTERLAWAKTSALVETIGSIFGKDESSVNLRTALVQEFKNCSSGLDNFGNSRYKMVETGLVGMLLGTINQIALDVLIAHGTNIYQQLSNAWQMWLMTWQEHGNVAEGEAELIVRTINLCAGHSIPEELYSHPKFRRLADITNIVCYQLRPFKYLEGNGLDSGNTSVEIESNMQELAQLVLSDSSNGLDPELKKTFLAVAKTFYYTSYCNIETINLHISRVLFEYVL